MNTEEATKIVLRPHITERTFSLVENESKICFIVNPKATKSKIADAIKTLYNKDAIDVNTCKTIYGKKAFVKFADIEKARDLATKIGML